MTRKFALDVVADRPPASYRPVAGDKPCKECPFRRASMPGWLGEATPQSFMIEISMEHPLPCHLTIDYADPAWLAKWTAQTTGRTCAGSLIMTANMCKRPRDPHFPRLPADRDLVFARPDEFIAHHENASTRSWEMASDAPKEKRPMPPTKTRKATKAAPTPPPSARDNYVEEVRDALDTEESAMSRADYIDALEEIASEVESRLECARAEQLAERRR